jgi:hypothetical protein
VSIPTPLAHARIMVGSKNTSFDRTPGSEASGLVVGSAAPSVAGQSGAAGAMAVKRDL